MRIEDVTGLSRGTISDAASEARTATELKILKQRSYQTNADIQQSLEDTLKDVIYIMNAYCDLYEITKEGKYDVNFEWDDSIIVDVDTELGKRITLMQNGLASKLENRMWYFGETERQAKEALLRIDEESQQDMEQDLIMQSNLRDDESPFPKKKDDKPKDEVKDDAE
jgi:A118 family predicted phage portal protein